jgi:hypothetical protein
LPTLGGIASTVETTDPQIIWDASTNRFYYVFLALFANNDLEMAFGFSTTSQPTTAADFCHYLVQFGDQLPDYPKLGDTREFALIGFNQFESFARRREVRWLTPSGMADGTSEPVTGAPTGLDASS